MVSELIFVINWFCLFDVFFVFFFCVIFSVQRTRRKKKQDCQPVEGRPISVEGNDHVGVDVVPKTGREHTTW